MKYSQDFIDRVREATNIVDLIRAHVELRQSGGSNYQGLCPFHHEKTPSFSVSEAKQVYHCFGCKESGNVYSFCQKNQGMTFRESVEYLAQRAGIPLPKSDFEKADSSRDLRSTLYKINGLAAQFYHQNLKSLPAGHPAKTYLQKRGLSEDLVDAFKIGYAPEGWSELTDFFARRRVPEAAAEQLGLIKRRTGGRTGHYDLFRHRILFPTFSPAGQCLGFGGRVLNNDQQPKYLNSPDSMVYHKGKILYGLQHSSKFLRSSDEAIVVEGYMDWLALAKVSMNNIVAVNGTALTADHARLIKRYTNKVLLLFDGDNAGKNAARRSLPILLSEGLMVRGLFLPDGLDPDDFVKARGESALRSLLDGAPDLFDLVASEEWLSSKGSPTGKVRFLDDMAPILAAIPDSRLRRLYAQNLANLADVNIRLVEQSIIKVSRSGASVANKPSHTVPKSHVEASVPAGFDLSRAPRPEVELLNVILLKEVYLNEAIAADMEQYFTHSGAKALFQRCVEVYRQMPSKFDNLSALLAGEVKPSEAITRHLSEQYTTLNDESAQRLLQDCMKSVKKLYLKAQSKELLSDIRGKGSALSTEKLEQIMNIHKNRRSLNRDS